MIELFILGFPTVLLIGVCIATGIGTLCLLWCAIDWVLQSAGVSPHETEVLSSLIVVVLLAILILSVGVGTNIKQRQTTKVQVEAP